MPVATGAVLDKALKYAAAGFSVLPIEKGTKKPISGWVEFMARKRTVNEIMEAWQNNPGAGVGIVTGRVSGIVVVDVDAKHPGENGFGSLTASGHVLPPTYMVKTGSGMHFYYRWIADVEAPNVKAYLPGVDIQGEKALVIAPPTIHPNGLAYEALNSMEMMADAPAWLVNLQEAERPKLYETNNGCVMEGSRNVTAASKVGALFREVPRGRWDEEVWPRLCDWNRHDCHPSLTEEELRATYDSIRQRAIKDTPSDKKMSEVQMIIDAIESTKPVLFRDELGVPCASISLNGHRENLPIHGKRFADWLRGLLWQSRQVSLKRESLSQAVATLAARASFEGTAYALSNRVAVLGNDFWYDLTQDDWAAVRVTANGWTIDKQPPILFRRESHQAPQVTPVSGGNLEALLTPYFNVSDQKSRLLLVVWTVAGLIPEIPLPILALHGDHGSAKTSLMKLERRIIDPSRLGVLSMPSGKELVQMLSHHRGSFFDNLSSLSKGISDTLCRAVTGEGTSKRELYTNDEDVIYSYRRCVALNGVNNVAEAADLMDRCLMVRLDRIPPENRKSEDEIWMKFEADLPQILGAALDVVSCALRIIPDVKLAYLPRMADFARWGYAITQALGHDPKDFLEAYLANAQDRNTEVLSTNPVAVSVMEMLKSTPQWRGTATQLLKQLQLTAGVLGIPTYGEDWPRSASYLKRRLNDIKPNLEDDGIKVTFTHGAQRIIHIERIGRKEKDEGEK
jgi:hypothetical protein